MNAHETRRVVANPDCAADAHAIGSYCSRMAASIAGRVDLERDSQGLLRAPKPLSPRLPRKLIQSRRNFRKEKRRRAAAQRKQQQRTLQEIQVNPKVLRRLQAFAPTETVDRSGLGTRLDQHRALLRGLEERAYHLQAAEAERTGSWMDDYSPLVMLGEVLARARAGSCEEVGAFGGGGASSAGRARIQQHYRGEIGECNNTEAQLDQPTGGVDCDLGWVSQLFQGVDKADSAHSPCGCGSSVGDSNGFECEHVEEEAQLKTDLQRQLASQIEESRGLVEEFSATVRCVCVEHCCVGASVHRSPRGIRLSLGANPRCCCIVRFAACAARDRSQDPAAQGPALR